MLLSVPSVFDEGPFPKGLVITKKLCLTNHIFFTFKIIWNLIYGEVSKRVNCSKGQIVIA
jgi:hypothetical protein